MRVVRFSMRSTERLGDRIVHSLLAAPWNLFLAGIAGFYLLAAAAFAAVYLAFAGAADSRVDSFTEAFLVSMQALTVFGCGQVAASTLPAKGVVASAIFVGWIALLLSLALLMVRFIRLRPLWQDGASLLRPQAADAAEGEPERPVPEPDGGKEPRAEHLN